MKILLHGLLRIFFVLVFGVRVRDKIGSRPAIVVANHNSHLDVFALFMLIPLNWVNRVRAVAAADYFGRGVKGSIARYLFGALLIERKSGKKPRDVLEPAFRALENGQCLIIFPEGTRGLPGKIAPFKSGIGMLATAFPEVAVHPVFLGGIERSLPKGGALLVPFSFSIRRLTPIYGKDFTHIDQHQVARHIARQLEKSIRAAASPDPSM